MDSKSDTARGKVGVARWAYARSNSADDVLSTSMPCGSLSAVKYTDSQSKFRKLNPFSRSTPRLHHLSDSSSQDKMSIGSGDVEFGARPLTSVGDVKGSDGCQGATSGPKRKGAMKVRASGRRKSSLAAQVLEKARFDMDKPRSDAPKAHTPRYSVHELLSTSRHLPGENLASGQLGLNSMLCGFPAKSESTLYRNSPLCGTPDIGAGSTTASYRAYSDALSSIPFQHFFSKKVKSNLKRTKSQTRLERRKMGTPSSSDSGVVTCSEAEGSPRFSLKRTMSLGRLGKKKYKHNQALAHMASPTAGVMQASRSHESLLSSPTQLSNIDLTAPDVEIKPLHSSMLGQDHCFQVTTSNGIKYYSCRSAEERQTWIQHLRKTVEPHQEQSRRTDNSIRVWIQEAKNVPTKKRYFCELCLDGTIYARTSTKTAKNDSLFWGEQFEFANLPRIEVLVINVYKEPEKKKKKEKNILIGYLRVPVGDISGRAMVEKWYPVSSATVGKGASRAELAQIRVRGRYHSVDILPTDMYLSFLEYLERDHAALVDILEPVCSVKQKEEVATCLVKVLQKRHLACHFLSDIVMNEVNRIENNSLAFRGNTIATKAMEAYMKLVGDKYLKDTLGDFVKHVLECDVDCEVDPSRLQNNSELQAHQEALTVFCQMAWFKIINSHAHFPKEMRHVLAELRERCAKHERSSMSDMLISSFIFLRFLCPAILSPSLFKLCQELPGTTSARSLTLTAKTIQNLANFTEFGEKEGYMTFLNEFVERETQSMRDFIAQISAKEESQELPDFDGFIDLGKELAVLCSLLQDLLPSVSEEAKEKVSDLQEILDNIEAALKEPQNVPSTKCNNLTVYNQLFKATWNSTASGAAESKCDVTSEAITHQINEWSAFAPAAKYPGSALDNPHRNGGGTLPRAAKVKVTRDPDVTPGYAPHDLLTSHDNAIDLSLNEDASRVTSTSPDKSVSVTTSEEHRDGVSVTSTAMSPVSEGGSSVTSSQSRVPNPDTFSGFVTPQGTPLSPVGADGRAAFTDVSLNHSSTLPDVKLTYDCTLSDARLGPSQSTPARRLTEEEIHSSWGKMLSAAELVNGQGELIDLIKFADQEDEQMESSEQISVLASSGYQSFNSVTSPPHNHGQITTQQNHAGITTPENPVGALPSQGPKHEPLSFRNPLFGQLPSAYVKPKKTTSALDASQTANASYQQCAKTQANNVDISMQMKVATDSSLNNIVHSKSQVSRQAEPPKDLTFSWQRYSAVSRSADQGWANLNTPQSRAPLSSSLPSQILFSADHATPSGHAMQSPSHVSANDDYVTLAAPMKSEDGSAGEWLGGEGGQKKSAQANVRMGVSSVQRKVVEVDKTKSECEAELTLLREQLAETQRMLGDTQRRLLEEEHQRSKVIKQYEQQMKKSEEELHRKQEEKDRELHQLYQKLESQERTLRTEQMELQCVVSEKQRIIRDQEQRIHSLDAANNRLLSALGQLKERYNTSQHNGGVRGRGDKITLADTDGLKSSFC